MHPEEANSVYSNRPRGTVGGATQTLVAGSRGALDIGRTNIAPRRSVRVNIRRVSNGYVVSEDVYYDQGGSVPEHIVNTLDDELPDMLRPIFDGVPTTTSFSQSLSAGSVHSLEIVEADRPD